MLLDQVKEFINSNKNLIDDLTKARPQGYIYAFLQECLSLMEGGDSSKIDETFLHEYRYTVLTFTDVIIKTKTTQSEKIVIKAIANLLYNVSINYGITECSTELNALVILSEASKSLEDILYVLICIFNKLSDRLYEEPTTNLLSRKYYLELSDFLEARKSHDEKYNI